MFRRLPRAPRGIANLSRQSPAIPRNSRWARDSPTRNFRFRAKSQPESPRQKVERRASSRDAQRKARGAGETKSTLSIQWSLMRLVLDRALKGKFDRMKFSKGKIGEGRRSWQADRRFPKNPKFDGGSISKNETAHYVVFKTSSPIQRPPDGAVNRGRICQRTDHPGHPRLSSGSRRILAN